MILMDCNNAVLGNFLYAFKNFLTIVWIVGPLLAIISLVINFSKMAMNPENKKIPNNIRNSVIALVVLFMIPTIVNVSMLLAKDNFEISACWNQEVSKPNPYPAYIDTNPSNNQSVVVDPSGYENGTKQSGITDYGEEMQVTSCGSLEYCNKFLTSMYNNSNKLSAAIAKHNAPVEYSYGKSKKSWAEAIKTAEKGNLVATTCVVPTIWGLTDALGKRTVINSVGVGGFQGYKGKLTQYTKQYKFDGSMSVKTAIQKGMIQPGDIIGVKAHTFSIYSVNQKKGSAVVFDGGHRFTNKCKKSTCSTMMSYSASANASMRLCQIIRWVK